MKDIELENDLLKKKLNEINQKDNNIKDKVAIYLESDVHALRKPLYSSFFLSSNDNKSIIEPILLIVK